MKVDKGIWKEGNERCVWDTGRLVEKNRLDKSMTGVGWQ